MDDPMAELRRYRELSRRRNPLIHSAARKGKSQRQIALAAGLSKDRVWRILSTSKVDTFASEALDD